MQHKKLSDMVKGWFIGEFSPTALETNACEVAVKHYTAGEVESAHYHQIATEVTLIISGVVKMMEREWNEGDIIVLSPGETTAFEAITNAVTVVVKVPGALDDKYMVDSKKL